MIYYTSVQRAETGRMDTCVLSPLRVRHGYSEQFKGWLTWKQRLACNCKTLSHLYAKWFPFLNEAGAVVVVALCLRSRQSVCFNKECNHSSASGNDQTRPKTV